MLPSLRPEVPCYKFKVGLSWGMVVCPVDRAWQQRLLSVSPSYCLVPQGPWLVSQLVGRKKQLHLYDSKMQLPGLFGCLRSDRLLMSAGSQAPPLVAEG